MNPYRSPANSIARGRWGTIRLRTVLPLAVPPILILALAPLMATLFLRWLMPPVILPGALLIASLARVLGVVGAAALPCMAAGLILAEARRARTAKVVMGGVSAVLLLSFAMGVCLDIYRPSVWRCTAGWPLFIFNRAVETVGLIGLTYPWFAVGRCLRASRSRRRPTRRP